MHYRTNRFRHSQLSMTVCEIGRMKLNGRFIVQAKLCIPSLVILRVRWTSGRG